MSSADNSKPTNAQCLAIDLGAGSGRLVVGRILDGRWNLKEISRFRTPTSTSAEYGYQYWETDQILTGIEQCLAEYSESGILDSLGVDSWGVDYVLLDANLQPIGVPVCYRDKRTTGVMERVQQRIPREEIYARTGIQFLSFNTLYQLAACVEQQPQWMDAARHLLMIPDYLHFRLCGVLSNEYTNATTTQLCNLDGRWDPVLTDAIGMRSSIVRIPVAAGTILGNGNGAANGIKVIAPATHDTGSAVAGTPLQSDDEAYISSGTWSLMGIESSLPIATAEALAMNFTNEGGFERRFRVLKNIMGMWPIQRICDEHNISDFESLVRSAAEVDGWSFIIDVNDPEFLNPISMTDAIHRYCRSSHQRVPVSIAQLARCVFDSLALSYRKVKEQLESLCHRPLKCIRIVGGGCRNKLLNQLCADACGLPVIAGPVEASALGNLSAQMIALGAIENLDAARALIRVSFEMEEFRPHSVVPASILGQFEELLSAREMKGEACA